jgi:hypothetical protein
VLVAIEALWLEEVDYLGDSLRFDDDTSKNSLLSFKAIR